MSRNLLDRKLLSRCTICTDSFLLHSFPVHILQYVVSTWASYWSSDLFILLIYVNFDCNFSYLNHLHINILCFIGQAWSVLIGTSRESLSVERNLFQRYCSITFPGIQKYLYADSLPLPVEVYATWASLAFLFLFCPFILYSVHTYLHLLWWPSKITALAIKLWSTNPSSIPVSS